MLKNVARWINKSQISGAKQQQQQQQNIQENASGPEENIGENFPGKLGRSKGLYVHGVFKKSILKSCPKQDACSENIEENLTFYLRLNPRLSARQAKW